MEMKSDNSGSPGAFLLSLVSKTDPTADEKSALIQELLSPGITGEILAEAFRRCSGMACRHIVRLHGSRLPQDDLDSALLKCAKDDNPLIYDLLQYSKANPHRYGAELLNYLSCHSHDKLFPLIVSSESFDANVDTDAWLQYVFEYNYDNSRLHLILADARHSSKLNLTEMLNNALSAGDLCAILLFAAHPRCDIEQADQSIQNSAARHFFTLKGYIKTAKTPTGTFTREDLEKLELYSENDIFFSLMYAATCSGNLGLVSKLSKIPRRDIRFQNHHELSEFELASVAISHGHLEIAKYYIKGKYLGMEDYNKMLGAAQRAERPDLAEWTMQDLIDGPCPMAVEEICTYFDEEIRTGNVEEGYDIQKVKTDIYKYLDKNPNYPAIIRQIFVIVRYKVALVGLLNLGLPREIVIAIARDAIYSK